MGSRRGRPGKGRVRPPQGGGGPVPGAGRSRHGGQGARLRQRRRWRRSPEDASGGDVGARSIVDSDQCHLVPIRGDAARRFGHATRTARRTPASPVPDEEGTPCLAVGLRIDPNASRRIVDRGPPAEDVEGSAAFVSLWGEGRAQLRRFQDGAIVRAAVWNDAAGGGGGGGAPVQFHGTDRSMGGIVERIVQHVVRLHFTDARAAKKRKGSKQSSAAFELRNVLSFIDGVSTTPSSLSSPQSSKFADSLALHKNAMGAFESLAEFLRKNTAVRLLRGPWYDDVRRQEYRSAAFSFSGRLLAANPPSRAEQQPRPLGHRS